MKPVFRQLVNVNPSSHLELCGNDLLDEPAFEPESDQEMVGRQQANAVPPPDEAQDSDATEDSPEQDRQRAPLSDSQAKEDLAIESGQFFAGQTMLLTGRPPRDAESARRAAEALRAHGAVVYTDEAAPPADVSMDRIVVPLCK